MNNERKKTGPKKDACPQATTGGTLAAETAKHVENVTQKKFSPMLARDDPRKRPAVKSKLE